VAKSLDDRSDQGPKWRALIKCGYADVRIFEVVRCGEILWIYLRMLWVKCGCGNVDMPQMNVCYCLPRKHDKNIPKTNSSDSIRLIDSNFNRLLFSDLY